MLLTADGDSSTGVFAPPPIFAQPQIRSIYRVRQGRPLDLPEPTRTVPPPNSLLAQEASGVTYRDTDTLFVVGDGGTSVVQVSKTGGLIDSMTLALGSSPQGTDFYDTEGIAYVGGGRRLIEERHRQVNLFTYVPSARCTRAMCKPSSLARRSGTPGSKAFR
jgi:uncharacterized protein YjiK